MQFFASCMLVSMALGILYVSYWLWKSLNDDYSEFDLKNGKTVIK